MSKTLQQSTQLNPPQSTERWEQAFDALTDHVMILDLNGIIVWANRAIRDQVEPQTGPLMGQPYHLPYYGSAVPQSPPPWETVLAGALSAVVETSLPAIPGF